MSKKSDRREPPVPMGPRHRKHWRGLRRTCSCGLRWPCPDRVQSAAARKTTVVADIPAWQTASTSAYPQIGRVGLLTPAQAWRSRPPQ